MKNTQKEKRERVAEMKDRPRKSKTTKDKGGGVRWNSLQTKSKQSKGLPDFKEFVDAEAPKLAAVEKTGLMI